jgi:type IV secretion system protein VirD4
MPQEILMTLILIAVFGGFCIFMYIVNAKTLNIKSRTVGDGQHGSARFATKAEIHKTFDHVPYLPTEWRQSNPEELPQGIVVGCNQALKKTTAIVDSGDVHALMIGAAGFGKTAKFLFPNLEYACASGVSFLCTDTKGDLVRAYAKIAKECYGYDISILDLRNPTQSDGFNMLYLVNRYMDEHLKTKSLAAKAKAEKYAKITAKTIIYSGGFDAGAAGQNAFFYDAAEGLLTSVILIIAEFCSPLNVNPEKPKDKEKTEAVKEDNSSSAENQAPEYKEQRHIISIFKLIQDLLAPSPIKGKSLFQVLMEKLPSEHKARWFSGAALNSADAALQSVLSTALSRLNAFLDSEMEQVLCFDTKIDAEKFCKQKSAVFLVMPEEDNSKYFLVSLIIQQLYREMLSVADEYGGKLPNRAILFLDEFGTLPRIESAEMMFSASRSRRISIIAIIQSIAQLEKNYGKEGAEIIIDNCQLSIYGGFAPNSETATALSKNLGEKTVLSGSISQGRDKSQSLQMIGRSLMTTDELKSMKKDTFIVTKTGAYPMKTIMRLFFEWGIVLDRDYTLPEPTVRDISYADRVEIEALIVKKYPPKEQPAEEKPKPPAQKPAQPVAKYPVQSITVRHGKGKKKGMGDALKKNLDKEDADAQ